MNNTLNKPSNIQQALREIREMGLTIHEDNRSVTPTTEKAQELADRYYIDVPYILGNVPSGSDSLRYIDYDIMFTSIESIAGGISKTAYKQLHDIADEVFRESVHTFIQAVKEQTNIPTGIQEELSEVILEWEESLLEELENYIDELQ
ncbi:hypothetical protein BH780_gp226 [Bacillus phage Eldridge]|uniref:Uncharacterized protein n=1 Tax=Bacillus phage Eldridge TaxID=1776293 RepID=A0A0Y0AJF4_9CAUD|nr:hypothetical protein BH780_gp226 [Bacillus phage Eldridge]AMB18809.1 hypothetical protein Eldridge_0229 [Bacillus phage Eldridge]